LRKATISFVMFVRLSVRLSGCPSVSMEKLGSHWTDFHEIWYLSIFRKCQENLIFINIRQESQVLYTNTSVHLWAHVAWFFLEWEMFQMKAVNIIRTHILYTVMFFRTPFFNEILWKKYCRAGQITDNNMAHVRYTLDTYGYKNILRRGNTYCFSTITLVVQTPLNNTSYVHCLSCWKLNMVLQTVTTKLIRVHVLIPPSTIPWRKSLNPALIQ